MPASGIAIVSIPVTDPDRSLGFYRDALGFVVVRDAAMGPDRRWLEVAPRAGGTSLTLVTWFDAMPPGSVQGLVLHTDDIDQTVSAWRMHGVEVSDVESAPWGRFATLEDPDGNGLVLQQA